LPKEAVVRKHILHLTIILAAIAPQAVSADSDAELLERLDRSLLAATDFIIESQSSDGLWRSKTYGCFKDGAALTPYVMSCLPFLPCRPDRIEVAFGKGVDYLVQMVDENGNVKTDEYGLSFPVYTAASASRVVALVDKSDRNLRAQQAWLKVLRQYQLAEHLGWSASDPDFGGWGFAIAPPKKPTADVGPNPFLKANLTATLFGAASLRSAKVASDDPIWAKVLTFVKRCQNFSDSSSESDPRFDDGGFFFSPEDGVGNKAGIAGTDRLGRQRYNSYGSMTGDGLRALLCCGLAKDHPRVVAARKWLEKHFTVKTNPGNFSQDRRVLQNATYYYYLWSVAHSFTRLGVKEIETEQGKIQWAPILAAELIRLQRPDGTWTNRFTDAKEDDPLVATPWAAAVLANCRFVISTPGPLPQNGCPGIEPNNKRRTVSPAKPTPTVLSLE
jgi:squalene-hopene/tetraprenyl-beta-curcumene cyclase